MVDSVRFDLDISGLDSALQNLENNVAEHLARSGALAGARVIRDEVRARTPVYTPEPGERINRQSLRKRGALQHSIYLAYAERKSSSRIKTYRISWNRKEAPHGHLVEFGHWLVINGKRRRWVSGKSFVRSGYEAALQRARQAVVMQIRQRFPELVRRASR